ncbi:GPT1 [Brettanomyces bruxellensis]|uniref:DEBR0S3_04786g1_1 n=1 Tax=Dekkera bruxellensis TaxID=5007 RepID=A0A7D9H244_DEKBR|nr:GPT1 [Brettanomyces bruxellensis]
MKSVESLKSTQSIVSVDEVQLNSAIAGRNRKILVDHPVDNDEAVILALGYKAEFKREFSLWTIFGVAFSVLGLLPSIASTLFYSLAYAGNAGITWGFAVGIICIIPVALNMAEIASAFPTSGGLYYATAMLSPPKYKALFSWIVGWSNYFYQVTGAPSVGYGCASMVLALASVANPNYVYQTWHCYLLTVAITTVCAVLASLPTKWIAGINAATSVLNIVFLFISWVFMLGGNNRVDQGLPKFNSDSFAWSLDNLTDWPDGIAILLSFMAVLWTMCGFDSPFHITEECSNAQVATPKAIVMTATIGGLLGFVFQLGIAYTIVDIDSAVNDELGQPYISYLNQIMTRPRVLAIGSFAAILAFTMTFSCMIAASRVLFSYSRDQCFPLSRYWCHVNKYTKTPVNAVWANWFIGILLLLLMFGNVAIDAIFSVGSIAPFVSFSIPTLLRITYARKFFKPGPWNLGKFTYISGFIGCAFVFLMIPISAFPQYRGSDNTLDLMNWTCVVYYGSMMLVIAWYFIYAHKVYKGPRSNLGLDTFSEEKDSAFDVVAPTSDMKKDM